MLYTYSLACSQKVIKIKDIEICAEEAKINPQSLFFAARKCTIASPNWTLTSDKTYITQYLYKLYFLSDVTSISFILCLRLALLQDSNLVYKT